MPRHKLVIFLTGIIVAFTSCIVQESFMSVQIEVMQPGKFAIPCAQRSIAVVNRDYSADSVWLQNSYFKPESIPVKVAFAVIPAACSSSLVKDLEKYGQFRSIKAFSSLFSPENQKRAKKDTEHLFQTTRTDLCICLDSFHVFRKEVGT